MIMMRNMHPMAAGMLALACMLALVVFTIDKAFVSTQYVETQIVSKRLARVSDGKNTKTTHEVRQVCFELKGESRCRNAPPELFVNVDSGVPVVIEFTEGRITGEIQISSVRKA